jgi:hypothetical protein
MLSVRNFERIAGQPNCGLSSQQCPALAKAEGIDSTIEHGGYLSRLHVSGICKKHAVQHSGNDYWSVFLYIWFLMCKMCMTCSSWRQHHKNKYAWACRQICMSMESIWRDTRSQKVSIISRQNFLSFKQVQERCLWPKPSSTYWCIWGAACTPSS